MSWLVFSALMGAAILHAGWNSLIRNADDRQNALTMLAAVTGVGALLVIPFFPLPHPAAWPWIILSAVLHIIYLQFLGRAYRIGELAEVYPISRGTAPILSGVLSYVIMGQRIEAVAVAGIALLIAGVVLLSLKGNRHLQRIHGHVIGYGLAASVMIAAYTLADAMGAKANGSVHSFALWMFLLYGLGMPAVAFAREGRGAVGPLVRHWKTGVITGIVSCGAYWLVIWSMTRAPVALVAALRETSVFFAAIISVVFLKERLTRFRIIAALLIVSGVVLMKLA